ncbi:MAG: nuclear transport factor 2 family protein [Thiohalocapsa sp.]
MRKQGLTMLMLALAMSVGSGTAHSGVEQETVDSVRTLWEGQHKALDAHDVEGVLATYADSDDIMLMGTGPGEHWVGKAEVKDAYTHFIEGFDANTMEVKCGEGAGSTQGDVTWVTAVCHFTDKKADQARSFVANVSAVLVKQGDALRFHTMHFSHLTDGDQAELQASTQ